MTGSDRATGGLELAVVGNSRIGALIDTSASIVWMCVPRFDGDPVFCSLLDNDSRDGRFDIELEQCMIDGKMVLNLLPPGALTKFEALRILVQHGRCLRAIEPSWPAALFQFDGG